MSRVNNALLSFDILEDEAARVAEVNAALPLGQEFANGWSDAECWWGGSKFPEHPLWGAAFNFVELAEVTAAVCAARWEYPEHVQLLWCGQDDDVWSVHVPARSEEKTGD